MNRKTSSSVLAVLLMLMASASLHVQEVDLLEAKPVELKIDAGQRTNKVSPIFYGLMMEEINYSYDVGL